MDKKILLHSFKKIYSSYYEEPPTIYSEEPNIENGWFNMKTIT